MTYDDVALLCDLFYLPFEHGGAGTQILHDFNWLRTHAHVVCNSHASNGCVTDAAERAMKDPEVHNFSFLHILNLTSMCAFSSLQCLLNYDLQVLEWYDRATKLDEMTKAVNQLFRRLTNCPNRELLHELYPYIWDIRGIISVLNSFVKWLGMYCSTS